MLFNIATIVLSTLIAQTLASPAATTTKTTTAKTTTTSKTTTTTTTTTRTTSPTSSPTSCSPPTFPTRPACGSNGSGAFSLQLAKCGNAFDGQYLNAVSNTTSNATSANAYAQKSGPNNDYLYPGPGFTYGPWAWKALFAGAVDSGITGLGLVSFVNGGNYFSCGVTADKVPFNCGVANWVVNSKTGELFTASSSTPPKGYVKVVPYIVQSCSS